MNIRLNEISDIAGPALCPNRKIRRVLFVAYAFPPVGGVSVQRVSKFVKYLPEYGWTSSVLTVENPSVPLFDETLVGEIPPNTLVRRARTLEPGYGLKSAVSNSDASHPKSPGQRLIGITRETARKAFNLLAQPDPQILWRPFALREGMKLLREVPHDAIVATGPPFSSLLLGSTLSKRTGVPLAVDYRDEWSFMTYWENKHFGRFTKMVQGRMQAHVLKSADLVLATTPSTANELKSLVQASSGHAKVEYVYNGFDPADYPSSLTTGERTDYGAGTDLFRMSFVGTLWNLTPIGPVVDGIIAFAHRAPDMARKLEIVIAGRRTAQQEAELDRLASTPVTMVRLPFVAHKEAIGLMCHSDALLLINADLPDAQRLINAKSFEYMAARRPIFLVAPHGELWRLLADMPEALKARPDDVEQIASNFETAIGRWQRGAESSIGSWDLSKFERRHLTGRLARLLDDLVGATAPEEHCA